MKKHSHTTSFLPGLALGLFALAALSLGACDSTDKTAEQAADQTTQEATGTASPAADRVETNCYQRVTGSAPQQDIELLILNVKGQAVSGEYHWLPAQKDQRRGSFTGQQTPTGISAKYTYQQEGQTGTTELILTQRPDKIEVAGGPPELGLSATLPKINCDQRAALPSE